MLPLTPLSSQRADSDRPGDGSDSSDADPVDPDEVRAAVAVLEASRVAYVEQDAAPAAPEPTAERAAIATYGDLSIGRLSPDTQLIGFHEAYFGNAVRVEPAGPVQANLNPGKSAVTEQSASNVEPASMILPPRDRPTDAHSAIDVAIPAGSQVRAPVDGTVVNVLPYTLYGEHPDTRVEIVPDDAPATILVMLHVSDVQVEPGDRLVAGETVVANSPTSFPFESQIDRFATQQVGQAHPHVHLELKPAV